MVRTSLGTIRHVWKSSCGRLGSVRWRGYQEPWFPPVPHQVAKNKGHGIEKVWPARVIPKLGPDEGFRRVRPMRRSQLQEEWKKYKVEQDAMIDEMVEELDETNRQETLDAELRRREKIEGIERVKERKREQAMANYEAHMKRNDERAALAAAKNQRERNNIEEFRQHQMLRRWQKVMKLNEWSKHWLETEDRILKRIHEVVDDYLCIVEQAAPTLTMPDAGPRGGSFGGFGQFPPTSGGGRGSGRGGGLFTAASTPGGAGLSREFGRKAPSPSGTDSGDAGADVRAKPSSDTDATLASITDEIRKRMEAQQAAKEAQKRDQDAKNLSRIDFDALPKFDPPGGDPPTPVAKPPGPM